MVSRNSLEGNISGTSEELADIFIKTFKEDGTFDPLILKRLLMSGHIFLLPDRLKSEGHDKLADDLLVVIKKRMEGTTVKMLLLAFRGVVRLKNKGSIKCHTRMKKALKVESPGKRKRKQK